VPLNEGLDVIVAVVTGLRKLPILPAIISKVPGGRKLNNCGAIALAASTPPPTASPPNTLPRRVRGTNLSKPLRVSGLVSTAVESVSVLTVVGIIVLVYLGYYQEWRHLDWP